MSTTDGGTGIRAAAGYVPRYRLTGEEINRSHNQKGGRGARSLAGPDEDSLTLAVEAARRLPPGALDGVTRVLFCSATPPYLVKNNASAAATVLGLGDDVLAVDAGGSLRSAVGALLGAAPGTLVLAADVNTSRPGSPRELTHGDAGAAVVVCEPDSAAAVIMAAASRTDEIQDQWRDLGQRWISQSEDRFPVARYGSLLADTVAGSSDASGGSGAPFATADRVVVSAPSARVTSAAEQQLGDRGKITRPVETGYAGSADFLLRLCGALAESAAGQTVLLASLTDGCDVVLARAGETAGTAFVPGGGGEVVVPTYLQALTWRGVLEREPPRRPEPRPVSAPAALRGAAWKYKLLASECAACGFVSTPPQEVCLRCGSAEHAPAVDMSRQPATIRTFSVDRLAYSLNPPMVAAVIGFERGGRLEVEITDSDPAALRVGAPVRMIFRHRNSSGGIHNYVWKAVLEGGAS
jgi:3-hydroxy-3-methylglutaryl CoA synthase/uncharacterized OB-fold protein